MSLAKQIDEMGSYGKMSCLLILIVIISSLEIGCATPRVTLDRDAVGQAKNIGYFAWRGSPLYITPDLASTIVGIAFGDPGTARSTMYNSGVYDEFQTSFTEAFNTMKAFNKMTNNNLTKLDMNDLVYKDENREKGVDAIASAKKQGYDLLVETTVKPAMSETSNPRAGTRGFNVSVDANVTITRITDSKILWNDTVKVDRNYYNYSFGTGCSINECSEELKNLARKAAEKLYKDVNKTVISKAISINISFTNELIKDERIKNNFTQKQSNYNNMAAGMVHFNSDVETTYYFVSASASNNYVRIGMFFNVKDNATKKLYESLFADKENIEKENGIIYNWLSKNQKLPGSNETYKVDGGLIFIDNNGSIDSSKEDQGEKHKWVVDNLINLKNTLNPYIKKHYRQAMSE